MKKILLMFVMLLAMVPAMAQTLGLIKDEGGWTNIRKGPGSNYAIVDKVQDGGYVYFYRTTANWYKVGWENGSDDPTITTVGYVHKSKIVVPPRVGPRKTLWQVKPEGGYTNIRKGPGTSYAIVGKVKDGSFVLCSGSGNWIKVYTQSGQLRGYISGNKVWPMESPSF